jgi:hypothetical protein
LQSQAYWHIELAQSIRPGGEEEEVVVWISAMGACWGKKHGPAAVQEMGKVVLMFY